MSPKAEREPSGARTLWLAASVSALLAVLKFVFGLLSGSLIVLASAADSFADALMSAANGWGYAQARVVADEDHPYGHGKLEGAFAVGQGMLLVGIVVTLVGSAVVRLAGGATLPRIDMAVATLVVSGLAAIALSVLLTRAADEERSVVLAADRAHYRVDALAAAAGVGGLLAAQAGGVPWLDPAVCLVMAVLMAQECAGVLRQGLAELLDEALPDDEVEQVRAVLERNQGRVTEFHGLRTRRGGPIRFVEVHAVFPGDSTLHDVHVVVQDIGAQIRAVIPGEARVLVHPDAEGLADAVDVPLEA